MHNGPLQIENSPIEFVLAGPRGGRDRILLKSGMAGLDLIGFAAEFGDNDPDSKGTSDLLSTLFSQAWQLNIVTSIPMADIQPEADSRKSKFRFAWKGLASPSGIKQVKSALNESLPELHLALESGDRSEIEWALGPVIFRCIEAGKHRLRLRRAMLTTFAIYALAAIAAIIFEFLKRP